MTPAELAAIEARHTTHLDDPEDDRWCQSEGEEWPCDTAKVLAALRTEQEARARVEAALRKIDEAEVRSLALVQQSFVHDTRDAVLTALIPLSEAIRAALAPDARG